METGPSFMATPKKNSIQSNLKKISILISQDGFSFYDFNETSKANSLILEKKFEKTSSPEEILEQIELVFHTDKMDWKSIEKISLIYATNLYCFVPLELFDEKHLSDYLKFNTKILNTDFLTYDLLQETQYVNVFVPYANINNFFFEKFGVFEYTHSASLLVLNTLQEQSSANPKITMSIYVYWKHFDLVVVKNGKLLLGNSFTFETPEDFVYYILFVAEQLKLDPEKFSLEFSGNISELSEHFLLCCNYIRNCHLSEKQPPWEMATSLSQKN